MKRNILTADQLLESHCILVNPRDSRSSEEIARAFGLLALDSQNAIVSSPQSMPVEQNSNR